MRARHGSVPDLARHRAGISINRTPLRWLTSFLFIPLISHPAIGQESARDGTMPAPLTWDLGAQGILLLTHATPALQGDDLTEGYVTQPNLMGRLALDGGRWVFVGTLNLEGATLRRGELNAGIWGEGYVDRRHPHTYLHELMATARVIGDAGSALEASISVGKGFVPFGTDDPMMRPFVKYPANHHLAQILEREVGIVALRYRTLVLEASIFNGDEPEGPSDLPDLRRFGDSWSTRATLHPLTGVELAGSYAAVASPEFPSGGGLDHRKTSLSARYAGTIRSGDQLYALVEWARTAEYEGERRAFAFHSLLAEIELRRRATGIAFRYERTHRPEEERLGNPFRSPRPPRDFHILGVTRWDIATARIDREWRHIGAAAMEPFVEIAHLWATQERHPSVFVPADFYGSSRMWSLSLGIRVEAGTAHRRMGRYGVTAPHPGAMDNSH